MSAGTAPRRDPGTDREVAFLDLKVKGSWYHLYGAVDTSG
jgi:hypothetical protein